jgi:hypothetical protein
MLKRIDRTPACEDAAYLQVTLVTKHLVISYNTTYILQLSEVHATEAKMSWKPL